MEAEQGEQLFHALPTPSSAEVADIARRTAERLHRAFKKKGRSSPWDDEGAWSDAGESDPLQLEQPGLFACYQAAASGVAIAGQQAGQPVLRLLAGAGAQSDTSANHYKDSEPAAEALGVNLYAKQVVSGYDRARLERLCRYVMRPALSQERLEWRSDGCLELSLKHPWKDGTRALVLEPHDLLVRLCATVPPPWFNMVRYFGVLSSHSRHRALVVPSRVDSSRFSPEPAVGEQLELALDRDAIGETKTGRARWGWLLRHVFRADVETCPRCGGPMRWVEAATEPEAIARLLAKQGLGPQPPPSRPPELGPAQLRLPFE